MRMTAIPEPDRCFAHELRFTKMFDQFHQPHDCSLLSRQYSLHQVAPPFPRRCNRRLRWGIVSDRFGRSNASICRNFPIHGVTTSAVAALVFWICYSAPSNLADFLLHIRNGGNTELLWADAIWIREDDDNERSHQVSLVSSIFSSAECVLVWLGPGFDSGPDLLEHINQNFQVSKGIGAKEQLIADVDH